MVLAVNSNQKGNPVLNKFKAQSWTYEEIVPDYQIGKSNGLLFLSLKYHRIHPEYIQPRLIQLEKFNTKILLVVVDISQAQNSIRELSILAIDHNFQVVLAWTDEDAAKYIETFKKYESKTPESIREKVDESSFSKFSNFIAQIKSVNKTDVVTLSSHFKSVLDIINADAEKIKQLPGFGTEKARKLTSAFDMPFLANNKS